MIAAIFTVIFTSSVIAVNNDHNLSGVIWQSDGSLPSGPTNFCIWVERIPDSDDWKRFPATGWIQTQKGTNDDRYWYSYVLPNDEKGTTWDSNDFYKVHVDGSLWGEFDGNTTSNATGSAGDPVPAPYDPSNPANSENRINFIAGGGFGNEQQWDVRSVSPIDLVPLNITADGMRPSSYPGGIPTAPNVDVPIFFNITNIGSVSSGDFYVSFWNCTATGQNFAQPPFDIINIPSIDGGIDTGMLSTKWFSQTAPGAYYVNLTVDTYEEVDEFDEVNNRVIIHFVVGPEINFKEVFIEGNPPSDPIYVGPGSPVDITAVVQNTGPSPTGGPGDNFTVTVYNITGPGGTRIPGSEIHVIANTLNSMEETVPPLLWTWYAPSVVLTDVWVNISIDFYDDVWEANEDNNEITLHFNVPDTPVTTISATSPIDAQGSVWYIDSTTDLYFDAMGSYPPFTVWHRITDQTTSQVLLNWSSIPELTNFDMSSYGEGTYKIEFYSIDSVPNTEIPTKNKIIIVDDSEPATSISFSSPRYRELVSDN
jgi:hypothetical protein